MIRLVKEWKCFLLTFSLSGVNYNQFIEDKLKGEIFMAEMKMGVVESHLPILFGRMSLALQRIGKAL